MSDIQRCPGRPRKYLTTLSQRLQQEGWSIGEIAQELGIGPAQVYKILSRTSMPSPRVARLLAQILGLSLEEVFFGD